VTHKYANRTGVAHTEILLPETAPLEYANRATLWNAVEKSEKRINSQTAREIEVALPVDLDRDEQIKLARDYATSFTHAGMCADLCIHDKGDGNPHAHIMLTTREVTQEGFTIKNRDWNKVEQLEQWRERWATLTNAALEQASIAERVDHRSYAEQGIYRVPTMHVGVAATAMERRGIATDRGHINNYIAAQNWRISSIEKDIASIGNELKLLMAEKEQTIQHEAEAELETKHSEKHIKGHVTQTSPIGASASKPSKPPRSTPVPITPPATKKGLLDMVVDDVIAALDKTGIEKLAKKLAGTSSEQPQPTPQKPSRASRNITPPEAPERPVERPQREELSWAKQQAREAREWKEQRETKDKPIQKETELDRRIKRARELADERKATLAPPEKKPHSKSRSGPEL
jgi:hypothetical protein